MGKSLWFFALIACLIPSAALRAWQTNQAADVVLGQPNMTSVNGEVSAKNFSATGVYSDGTRLYVADQINNRVLVYEHIPAYNYAPADFVIGQPNMTSSGANTGGLNSTTLQQPTSVGSDGTKFYILDSINERVLIYNHLPSANNASADLVIGQPNMTSHSQNNGGLSANSLDVAVFTQAPFLCGGTKFYVADSSNHRVLLYNQLPVSNYAAADIVIGQVNMTSKVWGVSAAALNNPFGVFSDNNKLYIADSGNSRVLIYNQIPSTNHASADVVLGQPNMTSNAVNNGGLTAQGLHFPYNVFSDGSRLYVTDAYNYRVLIYNKIPLASNVAADVVIGQPNMTSAVTGWSANTFRRPSSVYCDQKRMYVADVRLLVYYPPLYINSLLPSHSLPGQTVRMSIGGSFSSTTPTVKLSSGSVEIPAGNISVVDSNRLTCEFNLQAYPGVFNLSVTQDHDTQILHNAFLLQSQVAGPVQWQSQDLGQTWNPGNALLAAGIAIGDVDEDGQQEIIVAAHGPQTYVFKKNQANWAMTANPANSTGAVFSQVVVTDANRDEEPEIYASTSQNNLYQLDSFHSTLAETVANLGTNLNVLAGGDGDHDGKNKLYAACVDGHVYQFKRTAGAWSSADLGGGSLAMQAVAVGDGQGSNSPQVYAANADGYVYQFTYGNGAWNKLALAAVGEAVSAIQAVAIGCAEGTTLPAVYAANTNGTIIQFSRGNNTWSGHSISSIHAAITNLAIGDADNDGQDELYAACNDGHVYQVRKQGGLWQTADLGTAGTPLLGLAIGNGENANQYEIYAVGNNAHVYQFRASTGTVTPTPIPTAIALLKYFKLFHNQINPLHGEQALVRWSQPQAGPVSITVYNLLGDKIKQLVGNQEYTAGQYHEVKWDGRNTDNTICASGIYIVLLQGPGYKEVGKAAIVK